MKGRTLMQQMLLFDSFLPQLAKERFPALIVPPGTAAMLCNKARCRAQVLRAGQGFATCWCHDPCFWTDTFVRGHGTQWFCVLCGFMVLLFFFLSFIIIFFERVNIGKQGSGCFTKYSEHCNYFIPHDLQVPLGWVRFMQSWARVCVHVSCDIRSFGAAAAISVNGLKPFTSSWEYTPANCVPALPWDFHENDASEERRFQWYSALG